MYDLDRVAGEQVDFFLVYPDGVTRKQPGGKKADGVQVLYRARREFLQAVADFFHVDHRRLLLTPGCTAALNIAIMDQPWQPGDRVVTSHFEHHALHRNLVKLGENGVEVTVLPKGEHELIQG